MDILDERRTGRAASPSQVDNEGNPATFISSVCVEQRGRNRLCEAHCRDILVHGDARDLEDARDAVLDIDQWESS